MKASVTKLPKSTAELTVELESQELQPFLEEAAQRLSKTRVVPGFRIGNAPYTIMRKVVGDDVIFYEAVEPIVQRTLPKIVAQHQLITVGPPKIDLLKVAPGNPFIYKATVILLPKVELGEYRSLRVHKKHVHVSDEEVEKLLSNLRASRGQEKLIQRPSKLGDKVEIDFAGFFDNVPLEGLKSSTHPIVLGSKTFIPGFEEQLGGLSAGEQKEFTLRFPKDYHERRLADRHVLFRVKVLSVYEIQLPELNDAFAHSVGPYKNLHELKKRLHQNILEDKKERERQRFETAMLEKITEVSTMSDLPEALIDGEIEKMLEELKANVKNQGMDFGHYLTHLKQSEEGLKTTFRPNAERRLRFALVTRKLAEQEKIDVPDDEVRKEINETKALYQGNTAIETDLSSPDYFSYLKQVLMTKRVYEFLDKLIGVEAS